MLPASALQLDLDHEIAEIAQWIRTVVGTTLRRRGAVVGVSGGIDSAACAALCAHALAPGHVIALLMPDGDSSDDSSALGRELADALGIECVVEDITALADAAGVGTRQREAIRTVFPDYGDGWKSKLTIPGLLDGDRLNVSRLVVEDPDGNEFTERLSGDAYRQIVAATNFKQRTRTMMEYYHADRLHYAVCGTPNRLEYDQGFFVKGGDGLADFKPIAHLYKSQVYDVARALGVPQSIIDRPPTTDTFSLPQTQEEFYFGVPHDVMDRCLYALNHGLPAAEVADGTDLTDEQVQRVYDDIAAKRRATRSLHVTGQLVRPVPEI